MGWISLILIVVGAGCSLFGILAHEPMNTAEDIALSVTHPDVDLILLRLTLSITGAALIVGGVVLGGLAALRSRIAPKT